MYSAFKTLAKPKERTTGNKGKFSQIQDDACKGQGSKL
jgi:hypothetical protein